MKLNHLLLLLSIFLFLLSACTSYSKHGDSDSAKQDSTILAEKARSLILEGNTIRTRYKIPDDFERVSVTPGSFEEFLQNLPLKPVDTRARLYNGEFKEDSLSWYTSVIDIDIDPFDLQHSHESIIRLRAEYLYHTKQFDKISFIIRDNIPFDFNRWLQGYRIESEDIILKKMTEEKELTYENFREYLREVFKFTDAKSFRKNLRLIKDDDADNEFGIGTIIMSGRPPYHAVIVVDMIEGNRSYNTPGVLLAQGSSPAQEIEILRGVMDWLGYFPKNRGESWKEDAGCIWNISNKGELPIDKQGGNLDLFYNEIRKKQLLKFKEL